MNPMFPDRVRTQEDNHIRPIDTQKLDALLRIEEVLVSILEMQRALAVHLKAKTVEVSIPADEEKAKRKNSRQL